MLYGGQNVTVRNVVFNPTEGYRITITLRKDKDTDIASDFLEKSIITNVSKPQNTAVQYTRTINNAVFMSVFGDDITTSQINGVTWDTDFYTNYNPSLSVNVLGSQFNFSVSPSIGGVDLVSAANKVQQAITKVQNLTATDNPEGGNTGIAKLRQFYKDYRLEPHADGNEIKDKILLIRCYDVDGKISTQLSAFLVGMNTRLRATGGIEGIRSWDFTLNLLVIPNV